MTEEEREQKNKEYFFKELQFTEEQLEELWQFYKENAKLEPGLTPLRRIKLEYLYTSIGVDKLAFIGDKKLWINEDEADNV